MCFLANWYVFYTTATLAFHWLDVLFRQVKTFPALDLKNKRQETQVLCSSSKKLPWEKLHHCLLVHCAPPPVSTLQQAAWGDLWTNQKLVGLTKSKDHVLKFMGPLVQLGPHHVCTTLLHRPDTIMSVWNYVSRLCDTSFETSFRHKKTYQISGRCALFWCVPKIHFKSFLEQNFFLIFV